MLWLALPHLPSQLLQFDGEHGNIAAALIRGEGFADPFGTPSGPTAWIPPVFPCYVAAVFAVFGIKTTASAFALLVLDAVFAALCVLCTASILDLRGQSSLKPWFAAALLALTWLHEAAIGPWLSTTWFVAALAAAFLMAVAAILSGRGRIWWWLLGLTGAALSGTHAGSAAACLATLCALWLILARQRARVERTGGLRALTRTAALPLAALAACALVIGPWTARNWAVFHRIIPLKSSGWFEIELAEGHTSNGVLNDAVMLAHHPYSNPRLLIDYTLKGEDAFLEEYRPKAKALVAEAPMEFVRHVGQRALSVFSYCETAPHALVSRLKLSRTDADALVRADLAASLSQSQPVVWTSLGLSPAQFEGRLHGLGVADPRLVLRDWMNAKAAMLRGETEPVHMLSSIAMAGLPSACLLGTLALRRRRTDPVFALVALFYVVALLPNVVITHYSTHQLHFLGFHAFFLVSLGAALLCELSQLRADSIP
jgi:hypothetical protein